METVRREQVIVRENEVQTVRKRKNGPMQTVRKIGLVLTAVSGAILAAPVQLPQLAIAIITYLGVMGTIATAIGKIISEDDKEEGRSASDKQATVRQFLHR